MKLTKILMAAMAAFALAGCVKENQPVDRPEQDNNVNTDAPVKTITFEATLGADTKTELGDLNEGKRALHWEATDEFAVIVGTAKKYDGIGITVNDEDKTKCNFTFEMEKPGVEDNMAVFYPSYGAEAVEGGVQFTLDAVQVGPANGLPKRTGVNVGGKTVYYPLTAAVADAGNAADVYDGNASELTFKNVFGLLAFRFPNADIKSVAFKGNDSEAVAGTYVINASGEIVSSASTATEITMKTSDNGAFKNTDNEGNPYIYYMAIAPQNFENGFTLTFTTTTGVTFEKSTSKDFTLAPSEIVSLGSFQTGFAKAEPLWKKTHGNWYSQFASTDYRNIAMDDQYIYFAKAGGPEVHAVNMSDGSYKKTLSVNGIATGGVHRTSDLNIIDSETGSKLLVCNLINASGSTLRVYSYDNIDADPKEVLAYTLTTAYRFGDKFTVEGTWENGKLLFYDYSNTGTVAVFTITDGVINQTPEFITYNNKPAAGNSIGGMYKYPYTDNEYLWAGVNKTGAFSIYNYSNNKYNYVSTPNIGTGYSQGVCFFKINGKKYMSYIGISPSLTSANLNIGELTGSTLANSLSSFSNKEIFYLAGENSSATGVSNGNGTGDAALRIINGKTYIAGYALGSGIAVIEMK